MHEYLEILAIEGQRFLEYKALMKIVARMLVLLPLLWVEGVWAVDCPNRDYNLSTQGSVDAFPANCDAVIGDLIISDNFNESIINLDGLSNLRSVGGLFKIDRNRLLTDVNGLSSLVSIGTELYIDDNRDLSNLDGLSALRSVDYARIQNNDSLSNIDGLAGITTINRSLVIVGNDALVDVDGLVGLETVGQDLYLGGNTSLTNLDRLLNLVSVGRDLAIYNNAVLETLDGLGMLATVDRNLNISGNPRLTNLDGLAKLTGVGETLSIAQNGSLISIDGLANIASVGGSVLFYANTSILNIDGFSALKTVGANLEITNNPLLTNVDGLFSASSVGGGLTITDNAELTRCQSIAPLIGWPSGPPNDGVGGGIDIERNGGATGCRFWDEVLASVSGPTQPVITEATTSSNDVSLGFTLSTTTDTLFPITGYSASCTGAEIDVSGLPATELLDNVPTAETLTISGYDPTSVLSSIEVDLDITHSDPTDLYITLTTPEGTELILWNQGSSGGEDLVGTFPTTLTSVDSLDSVTRQTMDGGWVLSIEDIDVGPLVREGVLNSWGIRITEQLARNGSGSPIEVFGATRGRDYTCTVAPVTKLGTTPVSDPYVVSVPLELPSVPTITSTDYEDGKIILTVSVSDDGGTDITGYEAACTDGTNTFTGTSTSSPITVSGLTNDVAYTCTVTATNSVGTSSVSVATDPITPEQMSTGLPIWLLYQATQ